MHPVVEIIEKRLLLSASPPPGSQLEWLRAPPNVTAGERIAPLSVELDDSSLHRITDVAAQVQFTVVNGPDAGQTLGTAALEDGVATLKGLLIRTAGIYTIAATTPNAIGAESGFTISPARPAAMQFNGFPNYLNSNTGVQFLVEVVDKFGNLVATDHSRMTLGPATPKAAKVHIVAFDPQGNPFSGVLVRHGQQFGYAVEVQNGMAGFDLTASGIAGTATVKILDSNPGVRPLVSPSVPVP